MHKKEENIFKKKIIEEVKRDTKENFFITGNWGIGKSTLIKEALSDPECKQGQYKNYSIINISDVDNINLNRLSFYNKQNIGEEIIVDPFGEVEERQGEGIFSKIASSAKSLLESSEETKGSAGIVSSSIGLISNVYLDYVDNYPLNNFIIVIDEIDRLHEKIKDSTLINKIINIKNKYKNVKFIFISNEIPKTFKDINEKLYSRELIINESDYINEAYKYEFISEKTHKQIKKYKLKQNNIRILNLIEDIFNFLDNYKTEYNTNEIKEEDMIDIKNYIYLAGHLYFSKKEYLESKKEEYTILGNKKEEDFPLENIEETLKKQTYEFESFLKFNTIPLENILKNFSKTKSFIKLESDIQDYFENNYYLLFRNTKKNKIIELLENNYKELRLIKEKEYKDSDVDFIYWIKHFFEIYINPKQENIEKIVEIINNKFKYELENIKENKILKEIKYKKLNIIKKGLKVIKEDIESISSIKNNFPLKEYTKILENIDEAIKNLTLEFDSSECYKKYLIESNQKKKIIEHIINNSEDVFSDLRDLKEIINKEKIIEIAKEILKEKNSEIEEINIDYILEKI